MPPMIALYTESGNSPIPPLIFTGAEGKSAKVGLSLAFGALQFQREAVYLNLKRALGALVIIQICSTQL